MEATIPVPVLGLGLVLDHMKAILQREEKAALSWQENLPVTQRGRPQLTSQHWLLKQWVEETEQLRK